MKPWHLPRPGWVVRPTNNRKRRSRSWQNWEGQIQPRTTLCLPVLWRRVRFNPARVLHGFSGRAGPDRRAAAEDGAARAAGGRDPRAGLTLIPTLALPFCDATVLGAQDLTAEQLQEMAQRAQQASGEGDAAGQELQLSLEGLEGGSESGSECVVGLLDMNQDLEIRMLWALAVAREPDCRLIAGFSTTTANALSILRVWG